MPGIRTWYRWWPFFSPLQGESLPCSVWAWQTRILPNSSPFGPQTKWHPPTESLFVIKLLVWPPTLSYFSTYLGHGRGIRVLCIASWKLSRRNEIKIMAKIIKGWLLEKPPFTTCHYEEAEKQQQQKIKREGEAEHRDLYVTEPLYAPSLCTVEYLHMAPEKYHWINNLDHDYASNFLPHPTK